MLQKVLSSNMLSCLAALWYYPQLKYMIGYSKLSMDVILSVNDYSFLCVSCVFLTFLILGLVLASL